MINYPINIKQGQGAGMIKEIKGLYHQSLTSRRGSSPFIVLFEVPWLLTPYNNRLTDRRNCYVLILQPRAANGTKNLLTFNSSRKLVCLQQSSLPDVLFRHCGEIMHLKNMMTVCMLVLISSLDKNNIIYFCNSYQNPIEEFAIMLNMNVMKEVR